MNASKTQRYLLFALMLGAVVLSFYFFRPFLVPVALAAIFASILYPLAYTIS